MKQIILLHGALGCEEQLLTLKDLLGKEAEVRLFTFGGHGAKASDTSSFSMERLSIELADFVTSENLSRPAVFGYSMGGYAALTLAAAQPHLLGDIVTLGTKFNWSVETAQQESRFLNPEKTAEKVPAFAAYLQKLHGDNWADLMRNTAGMMAQLGENHLLPTDLATIQNRVLLLLGDADNMVTREETEAVQQQIPHASVEILNQTPHAIEKIDTGKLARKILEFI